MARLVLGPVLRRITTTGATVWVETDAPATVEVLGHTSSTFHVEGHHYAVVDVTGLTPGEAVPYEVRLDGDRCWPIDDGYPPSTIRPPGDGDDVVLALGSCQQRAPHHPPWTGRSFVDRRALGPDALLGLAARMAGGGVRPDALVLIGDQVYADEPSPATVEALERRRGGPPRRGRPQVASFEEYTWLYHEAWQDGLMRWLLSCVPSFMIFDDHDVIDDWNTSAAWRDRIEREPWWHGRISGGLMAYWLYQHLGNAAFAERQDDDLLAAVSAADDGGPVLRAFAERADAGTPDDVGHRWSYAHDIGPCRLVVLDSRNGRVLDRGQRSMLGRAEWEWFDEVACGDVDHLLVGTSVPWLLPRPLHDLEAWDEQVAGGAWGRRAARICEWLRQVVDLEQWAAFGGSFRAMADVVASVSRGDRGRPPATILVLSGDVHFGYVAEADVPGASRVRQIVSSPLRQATSRIERRIQRIAMAPPLSLLARLLARTTPAAATSLRWRITDGPWFDNHVVLLTLRGRDATLRAERAHLDVGSDDPLLEELAARPL
jgi:hypothetical protein